MIHLISPSGAVEFCPPLQMARDFINGDASNLVELFRDSRFWRICGRMTAETSKTVFFWKIRKNVEILRLTGCDRYLGSGYSGERYQEMNPVPGHDMEGGDSRAECFYRLLKKKYFWIWAYG